MAKRSLNCSGSDAYPVSTKRLHIERCDEDFLEGLPRDILTLEVNPLLGPLDRFLLGHTSKFHNELFKTQVNSRKILKMLRNTELHRVCIMTGERNLVSWSFQYRLIDANTIDEKMKILMLLMASENLKIMNDTFCTFYLENIFKKNKKQSKGIRKKAFRKAASFGNITATKYLIAKGWKFSCIDTECLVAAASNGQMNYMKWTLGFNQSKDIYQVASWIRKIDFHPIMASAINHSHNKLFRYVFERMRILKGKSILRPELLNFGAIVGNHEIVIELIENHHVHPHASLMADAVKGDSTELVRYCLERFGYGPSQTSVVYAQAIICESIKTLNCMKSLGYSPVHGEVLTSLAVMEAKLHSIQWLFDNGYEFKFIHYLVLPEEAFLRTKSLRKLMQLNIPGNLGVVALLAQQDNDIVAAEEYFLYLQKNHRESLNNPKLFYQCIQHEHDELILWMHEKGVKMSAKLAVDYILRTQFDPKMTRENSFISLFHIQWNTEEILQVFNAFESWWLRQEL